MAYRVLPDGSIETDTVEEAVELATVVASRRRNEASPKEESSGAENLMNSLWKPNRPNGRGTIEKTGRFGWRWSIMISRKRHVGPTYGSHKEALAALEKFVDTGIMPPKPPRAPYRCSVCLGDGHTKRRCSGKVEICPATIQTPVASTTPAASDAPAASAAPVEVKKLELVAASPKDESEVEDDLDLGKSMSRMKVERRRCSICDESDHQSNRCPTVPRKPEVPKKGATPPRQISEIPVGGPFKVIAGWKFFVVEDFVEEETGTTWSAGDMWTAASPTGKTHPDGYDEWNMTRGSLKQISYPQLHPFLESSRN